MRGSLEAPGVGQYNEYHKRDQRAAKWKEENQKKAVSKSVKFPPVGTYTPLPIEYHLFDNELAKQKRHKSFFSKEERFKKSKDKTVPFYNIQSEWGLKNKRVNKDILSRISSPNSNRSVYR